MLCCGLLAVIAAAIAGSWRRLGAARWIVPGAAVLLAIPAVASVASERHVPPNRADIAARAMQMLCGEPAE